MINTWEQVFFGGEKNEFRQKNLVSVVIQLPKETDSVYSLLDTLSFLLEVFLSDETNSVLLNNQGMPWKK